MRLAIPEVRLPAPRLSDRTDDSPMTKTAEAFDVIVLGAGAAGLMCALTAGQRGAQGPAARPCRQGRRQDSDLRRRALQFHQSALRAGSVSLRQSGFLQVGARPLHPGMISSRWSSAIASPITRRRSANCSATARRAPSSPCCSPNARRAASMSGSDTPSPMFRAATASVSRPATALSPPSALVLATGGLSIPKMGATGFAYDVARRFGLRIIETAARRWCR